MMQVRSFTRERWCFHIGPVQVIWMRRPIGLLLRARDIAVVALVAVWALLTVLFLMVE